MFIVDFSAARSVKRKGILGTIKGTAKNETEAENLMANAKEMMIGLVRK